MNQSALTDRTVLVTGGAGFIGSHIVDALAGDNDVRVLDDFSTGHRDYVPDDVALIEGSIRDPAAVERATRDVDLIFHEAAEVSVENTVDAPLESDRTNVDGTLAILERARTEDARVVLASSAAVYGHPDELPVRESTRTDPASPYGVQKLAADRYAALYQELYDVPTVALRYFNVYGPRQQGDYSGVISAFLERAREGEPIPIDGDGEQTRDFVHVSDVVRANLRAATTDHVGEAFNVGTGETTSIRDLAETIAAATGTDSPIVHREPRPGDVRHSRADVSKTARKLGFEARISLETGIRDLVSRSGSIEVPSPSDAPLREPTDGRLG